jgi:hypothetical protein
MAFMAGAFSELVLDATEAVSSAGFLSNTFHHFEEPIKKFAIDEVGKLTGEYAKSHPGGIIDQTIISANNYRMKKTRTTRQVKKLSR